jgi:hypothetical protein
MVQVDEQREKAKRRPRRFVEHVQGGARTGILLTRPSQSYPCEQEAARNIKKNAPPSAGTSDSTARSTAITFASCSRLEETNRGDLAGGQSKRGAAVGGTRGSSTGRATVPSQSPVHRRLSCGCWRTRAAERRNHRRTNRPGGGRQRPRKGRKKPIAALVAGSRGS